MEIQLKAYVKSIFMEGDEIKFGIAPVEQEKLNGKAVFRVEIKAATEKVQGAQGTQETQGTDKDLPKAIVTIAKALGTDGITMFLPLPQTEILDVSCEKDFSIRVAPLLASKREVVVKLATKDIANDNDVLNGLELRHLELV